MSRACGASLAPWGRRVRPFPATASASSLQRLGRRMLFRLGLLPDRGRDPVHSGAALEGCADGVNPATRFALRPAMANSCNFPATSRNPRCSRIPPRPFFLGRMITLAVGSGRFTPYSSSMKLLRPVLLFAVALGASTLHADEYDTLRARWVDLLTGGSTFNTADADIAAKPPASRPPSPATAPHATLSPAPVTGTNLIHPPAAPTSGATSRARPIRPRSPPPSAA
jgi:hypothetical protein